MKLHFDKNKIKIPHICSHQESIRQYIYSKEFNSNEGTDEKCANSLSNRLDNLCCCSKRFNFEQEEEEEKEANEERKNNEKKENILNWMKRKRICVGEE